MTTGRVRRAWLGIAGAQAPFPPALAAKVDRTPACRSRRSSTAAPPPPRGCAVATSWSRSTASRSGTSTSIQKLMVEGAIGKRVEITVWRNGALVDVIALPRELTDAP